MVGGELERITGVPLLGALLYFCLVPLPIAPAQAAAGDDDPFFLALSSELEHVWRWSASWTGGKWLNGYAAGREVEMSVVRSASDGQVCIADLSLVLKFVVVDREPRIVDAEHRSGQSCWDASQGFSRRAWAVQNVEQIMRLREQTGMPAGQAREPLVPSPRQGEIIEATYRLRLPVLAPPDTQPFNLDSPEVQDVARATARAIHRGPEPGCHAGEAAIPRFSNRDPMLLVYVDLPCGKGIVDIIKDPEGKRTLGRFTTYEYNLDVLVPRLRQRLLLTVRLP